MSKEMLLFLRKPQTFYTWLHLLSEVLVHCDIFPLWRNNYPIIVHILESLNVIINFNSLYKAGLLFSLSSHVLLSHIERYSENNSY